MEEEREEEEDGAGERDMSIPHLMGMDHPRMLRSYTSTATST
jgi:hypothetical protein